MAPYLLGLTIVLTVLTHQSGKRLEAEREGVTEKSAHLFTVVGCWVSAYEFIGHGKSA
jgi:hypothetical protein